MIVGNSFENDNNEVLKYVQVKSYGQSLSLIFDVVKKQYITADSILQANHPNIPLLNKINSFDHRVLQAAHDNIAAAFRYRNQNIKKLIDVPYALSILEIASYIFFDRQTERQTGRPTQTYIHI